LLSGEIVTKRGKGLNGRRGMLRCGPARSRGLYQRPRSPTQPLEAKNFGAGDELRGPVKKSVLGHEYNKLRRDIEPRRRVGFGCPGEERILIESKREGRWWPWEGIGSEPRPRQVPG